MKKNDFLQRFQLYQLGQSSQSYQYNADLKSAAVLIPIVEKNNQLQVLFTKRAAHLKHHGGQISFPGGKVEPSDGSLIKTALRETFEEIGLASQHISVLGKLNSYHTISGYQVTPIVGFIQDPPPFKIDFNEVSEIFLVPFAHFLDKKNLFYITVTNKKNSHQVNFMPYNDYNIWGATASMLKDLAIHLND